MAAVIEKNDPDYREFLLWKERRSNSSSDIETLIEKVNEFQRKEEIKKGNIVIWKKGLKNKKYPKEGQPAYVLDVQEDSFIAEKDLKRDPGSAYFLEPLNLKLAFIDDDGDLMVFYYDKSRFEVKKGS
jgi:hypothetical protein